MFGFFIALVGILKVHNFECNQSLVIISIYIGISHNDKCPPYVLGVSINIIFIISFSYLFCRRLINIESIDCWFFALFWQHDNTYVGKRNGVAWRGGEQWRFLRPDQDSFPYKEAVSLWMRCKPEKLIALRQTNKRSQLSIRTQTMRDINITKRRFFGYSPPMPPSKHSELL